MALQVSAAYKEEGRIERGKRRVNARYSLRNVRFRLSFDYSRSFFSLPLPFSFPEIAK